MASTIILSDNGASSGSAGLKSTAGNDGVLILQTTTSGGTATNAMYVTNTQQVGFGTSSPASSVAVSKVVVVENSSSAGFKATSTGGASLELYAAPSATYIDTTTNSPMVFYINGTERGRWNAGAPILCLSGGSTTATGTGIAFPATQSASTDANTLDDYEEGIWTPVLNFGGNDHDGSYSYQSGRYVKVGQLVYVCGIVGISTAGTRTGAVAMKGLPFGGGSSNVNGQVAGLYNSMVGINYAICGDGPTGGTTSVALYTNGTTGYSAMGKTNYTPAANQYMQFAFCYRSDN